MADALDTTFIDQPVFSLDFDPEQLFRDEDAMDQDFTDWLNAALQDDDLGPTLAPSESSEHSFASGAAVLSPVLAGAASAPPPPVPAAAPPVWPQQPSAPLAPVAAAPMLAAAPAGAVMTAAMQAQQPLPAGTSPNPAQGPLLAMAQPAAAPAVSMPMMVLPSAAPMMGAMPGVYHMFYAQPHALGPAAGSGAAAFTFMAAPSAVAAPTGAANGQTAPGAKQKPMRFRWGGTQRSWGGRRFCSGLLR